MRRLKRLVVGLKLSSLILPVLVALGTRTAYAVDASFVFASTYSSPTATPSAKQSLGLLGGGAFLNIPLTSDSSGFWSLMSLRLGGLYLSRPINTGTTVTETLTQFQLGFQLNLSRGIFIDFGGHYNMPNSNPLAFDTAKDYGAFGGLGFKIPLGDITSLLLQGQYHYAMQSLYYGSSGAFYTPDEFVFMLGINLGPGRSYF